MPRYEWPAPPWGLDDPERRSAHLLRFRSPDTTGTDGTAVTAPPKARRRGRAVAHVAPVGDQNLWYPIGPTVMTNGQAGGHPNVAGRIVDLAIEPGQGQRMYAASAGGGVWFSANRGRTWAPLDDFQLSDFTTAASISTALSCGAIHVIWGTKDDGTKDNIWVGTGEPQLVVGGQEPAQTAGGGPGGGLPGGNLLGVGLLNRDPSVSMNWQLVKGADSGTDPDTLRGHGVFRIVADPRDENQLVAATTNGLYAKPPTGSWTRLAAWAVGVATQPADVLLTRPTATKLRIWVVGASTLKVAELSGADAAPINNAALSFSAVSLPSVATNPTGRYPQATAGGTRLALATDGTTLFVLGRRTASGDRKDPPAALWRVDPTAAIAGLSGTLLSGMPDDLFMSAGDQSDYDMCIAAHPATSNRVYVGGATVGTGSGWNGAVYRCDTTTTDAHPTFIGEGVHADIHVLRVGPPAPTDLAHHTVWVGCDGGLFRSDSDGDPDSFHNSNDGLAVLQPGYISCHPTNPGIVVAGFQDNGTAIRVGDGLWRQSFEGDGGGVAFDPAGTGRYFRQYTQGTWQSSDGESTPPVNRRGLGDKGGLRSSEGVESDASQFYSGCDALAHGGDTHLVLGSDRVWYSRDWGRSWVTLPTATDPRATRNVDLGQDVMVHSPKPPDYNDPRNSLDCCGEVHHGITGPGIITVKLMGTRDDTDDTLVLRAVALTESLVVCFVATRPLGGSGPFTWTPVTAAQKQAVRAPTAAEATVLAGGGSLSFLPAPSLVSDLAVHEADRGDRGSLYVTTVGDPTTDTLWFFDGTSQWHATGLSTRAATWATVGDRVTSPAFGVLVDPDDRSVVYVATAAGVVRGRLTIGGTSPNLTYTWAFERFMNGLPTAAVQDLALFSSGGVKLLRAAVQSRGVWEVDLGSSTSTARTYLRLYPTDTRRVLPTPTGGTVLDGDAHNPTFWDDSPDVVVDTTGTVRTAPPTEAELATLVPSGTPAERERQSTTELNVKVHVLVHHRWKDPLPKAQVKVALLRHDLPDNGVVPVSQLWPDLVAVAAPGTAEPATLKDGWVKAASSLWLSPADDIDTRVPRAVTFDVDLSAVPRGTAVVFLAVVMSAADQISATDLSDGQGHNAVSGDQLVVFSPHVAARSIQVG